MRDHGFANRSLRVGGVAAGVLISLLPTQVGAAPLSARAQGLAGERSRATVVQDTQRTPQTTDEARQVSRLRAFARLYGYVRFFHPGDAGADLDWHRFAVHGAGVVREAGTPDALERTLETLFRPVAPTVDVYRVGTDGGRRAEPSVTARDSSARVVAWQHVGVDLGVRAPYRSYRLGR